MLFSVDFALVFVVLGGMCKIDVRTTLNIGVVIYMIENILLFPFRLLWNIIVTGLIIGGFVLWFGFIFGSVIAVVLILIFAPSLFLLPLALAGMYTKIWNE